MSSRTNICRSVLALVIGAGCGGSAAEPCDVVSETCRIEHAFASYDVAASEEKNAICFSWTMNNPEPIWINAVTAENDGGFHHSNWFWVPDNRWELPDGYWDCNEHGFDELAAAVFGGVLFAQSTQTRGESQQFRPGAAIYVPAYARIVINAHILNASDQALRTGLRVALDTIPESAVDAKLAPFRLNIGELDIPPMTRSEHSGDCDISAPHQRLLDTPLSMTIHYVLPHYHALGDLFRLEILGGERDGETIYQLENRYGEPLGKSFNPPIGVGDATGLRFTCGYKNPRAESVHAGIGDQEMCVMLGFAEMGIEFAAEVAATEQSVKNGIPHHSGDCNVVAKTFEW